MIKGAKKAVVRTPHIILGSKSTEDRLIIQWTKDFQMAEAALVFMMEEAERFCKSWKNVCSSQEGLVEALKGIYQPITEDNVYTHVQETPASAIESLELFGATLKNAQAEIHPIVRDFEALFHANCKSARECIVAVQKALTKREHKKIDYDRYSNNVEKQLRKEQFTDKEQAHLQKAEDDLANSSALFYKHDEKCKRYIPQFLESLSEFLNIMTSRLYLAQLDVFAVLKTHLHEYSVQQGLGYSLEVSVGEPAGTQIDSYDTITQDWESRFEKALLRAEAKDIGIINKGETVKKSILLPSQRKTKEATKAASKAATKAAINVSNAVVHKIKHPTLATNIRFSSPEYGMFRPEGKGGVPKSPMSPYDNEGRYSPSIFQSPITSQFDRDEEYERMYSNRARAVSSASARLQTTFVRPDTNEFATALFTFNGQQPGDVSFRKGDRIRVFDHGDEDDHMWWFGETADGRIGLFPANYIALEADDTSKPAESPAPKDSAELEQASESSFPPISVHTNETEETLSETV